MASSIPQIRRRRDTHTEAPVVTISLEGLRANEDIAAKQHYIIDHVALMMSERKIDSEKLLIEVARSFKAYLKQKSRPLDTKQDEIESETKRQSILTRVREVSEQATRNSEEVVVMEATMLELIEAGKSGDAGYVEWILMPNLVWNLASLG